MSPAETPAPAGRREATGSRASGTAGPEAAQRPRKSYRPPRLTEYGRLAELTRFGGSEVMDSGALGQQI